MRNLRRLAVLSLTIFGVWVAFTNGLWAHERLSQTSQSMDSVSRWEKHIEAVLAHVPRDTQVFGYVADWDIPDSSYDIIDQDTEYTLTQYALAPYVVQPGLDHEWIIGNFTSARFTDWLDQNLPSYELIRIGFGIYLIHRTPS